MVKEDIEVVDDEEFSYSKEGSSIKEIILRHIRKISDISCQELTASYQQEKPVKVGETLTLIKIYHPDLRLAYCNSVDFLLDILMPYSDEDFTKFHEKMEKDEEKEEEKFKGSKTDWIDIKLKYRRLLFGELNLMMHRINFFGKEEDYEE